jgi:hypothetical protein
MAIPSQSLPGYNAAEARAFRLGLPGYRRPGARVPGFVQRRLDEAANHPPGDAPLGVAAAVSQTPEGDERLSGEGGAELAARQVYPGYSRPTDPSAPAAASVAAAPAAGAAPATTPAYTEGPAARRLRELLATSPEDTNGRGRSALRMLGAPVQPSDSLGRVIGERIGNAVTGLIDKKADERTLDRPQQIAQAQAAAAVEAEGEKAQRTRDAADADVRLKNSEADWNRARPDIEAAKAKASAAKQEQSTVLSNLRAFKGERFDPADPMHAAFLERAKAAGIFVDPATWNDASSNQTLVEIVDPENPTQKRRALLNKATGELADVAQSGYVQPVGENGMTSFQTGSLGLGRERLAETQKQNEISNDLRRQGLDISRGHLNLSELSRNDKVSEQTRKEAKEAAALLAESERWQTEANGFAQRVKYKDPNTGEVKESKGYASKRDDAQARAEAAREQLYGSYGYLWDNKMTRDEFMRQHPSLLQSGPLDHPFATSDIDATAARYGITITDPDSYQNHARPTSNALPRRAAPAAARPSSSSASPAGGPPPITHRMSRETFRKNNPQYKSLSDGDVDAMLRQHGIQGY